MSSDDTTCDHPNFDAHVAVTRLAESGRFVADVSIMCAVCLTPMRFIGLPCGLDMNGAAVNPDATQATLAIAPKGEVIPAIDGAPMGFSMRRDGATGGWIELDKGQPAAAGPYLARIVTPGVQRLTDVRIWSMASMSFESRMDKPTSVVTHWMHLPAEPFSESKSDVAKFQNPDLGERFNKE